MELLKEMKAEGFSVEVTRPQVHCKVFEDNSGAIELATVHKTRPRTKHLNVKYHHFRHHVDSGEVMIASISSDEQQADLLTKPLSEELFERHRAKIMSW